MVVASLQVLRGDRYEVIKAIKSKGVMQVANLCTLISLANSFLPGTPHTHEPYLREWAKDCNCLIVSVDYVLAPERQFPHQVNEGTYVYKWLLDNNPWGETFSVYNFKIQPFALLFFSNTDQNF